MSHTSEPWSADEYGQIHDGEGKPIVGFPENARRIVACVNACAGWSTLFLESVIISGRGSLQTLSDETVLALHKSEQQRDELLAALKEYIAAADNSMNPPNDDDVAAMLRFGGADKAAREAIAKAEAA